MIRPSSACLLLAMGCPRPAPPPTGLDEQPAPLVVDDLLPEGWHYHGSCPSPALQLPPERCQRESTRGLDPSQPLEWGPGAVGSDRLWSERLVCPNGAVPIIQRQGNIGVAPEPSMSPRSGVPSLDLDVLDAWSIRCPGDREPRTWYTNMYRCGDPCPPQGFSILPVEASAHLRAAAVAMDENRFQDAMQEAQAAARVAPGAELVQQWLALALLVNEDYAGAREAYSRIAAINPDDLQARYHQALTARALGRDGEANALILDIFPRLPADDPDRPKIQCMAAVALHERGEASRAEEQRQASCTAGFADCCEISFEP